MFYYSGAGLKPVFIWFVWPLPLYKSDSWLLIHGFDHRNAAICIAFSLVVSDRWARIFNHQLLQEALDSFNRRRMGVRFWWYHSLSLACHSFISDFEQIFEMQVQGFHKMLLVFSFHGFRNWDTLGSWGLSSLDDGLKWFLRQKLHFKAHVHARIF